MPAIADLAARAYAKYVARIGRPPAPMNADFAVHVSRGEVTVAFDETGVSGFLVAYARAGDYFVENVAVDPDRSGQGLGKALMARAEAMALDLGRQRITLYTNAQMHENFLFYEALGYLRTGDVEEDGFHRVYFQKQLETT